MTFSYDFDSCALNNSNENDELTLDNWNPSSKQKKMIQPQWRKDQIGTNFNQQPGLDDVKKIKIFVKKKIPDFEIMHYFGINSETLAAIKQGKYCPAEGILINDLETMGKELKRINEILIKARRANDYIAQVLFIDNKDYKDYVDYCDNKKTNDKNKKTNKSKDSLC